MMMLFSGLLLACVVPRCVCRFSGEGRMSQVESAMKAAERGGLVVAVEGRDGAVICAVLGTREKAERHYGSDDDSEFKVAVAAPSVVVATAGMPGDARHAVSQARVASVEHWLFFGERPGPSLVARKVAQHFVAYSGSPLSPNDDDDEDAYQSLRPPGLAAIVCGLEKNEGAVYLVQPGGDSRRMRAAAIGRDAKQAEDLLVDLLDDKDGHRSIDCDEALRIAAKVLHTVALDNDRPAADSLRVAVLRRCKPREQIDFGFASATYDDGWHTLPGDERAISVDFLAPDKRQALIDDAAREKNASPSRIKGKPRREFETY